MLAYRSQIADSSEYMWRHHKAALPFEDIAIASKRNTAIVLIFACCMFLSSCDYREATEVFTKPRPWNLGETPEGSPTFRQGWEDGCDTGLGAYGGLAYRTKAYKFRQDITQIENPEYYRAWKDAYSYCRWYVWNWTRGWHE